MPCSPFPYIHPQAGATLFSAKVCPSFPGERTADCQTDNRVSVMFKTVQKYALLAGLQNISVLTLTTLTFRKGHFGGLRTPFPCPLPMCRPAPAQARLAHFPGFVQSGLSGGFGRGLKIAIFNICQNMYLLDSMQEKRQFANWGKQNKGGGAKGEAPSNLPPKGRL